MRKSPKVDNHISLPPQLYGSAERLFLKISALHRAKQQQVKAQKKEEATNAQ